MMAAGPQIEIRPQADGQLLTSEMLIWIGIALVTVLFLMLQPSFSWLAAVPAELTIPLARWAKAVAAAFTEEFKGVFRAGTWLLSFPLGWLRDLLRWLPWSAVVLLVAALG